MTWAGAARVESWFSVRLIISLSLEFSSSKEMVLLVMTSFRCFYIAGGGALI